MTKLKLCGIRRAEDIRLINEFLPDYCGFILSKPFKRYVSIEELRTMRGMVDKRIKVCGVFVDEPKEKILNYLKEGLIDIVQLHGREDEEYIKALKNDIRSFKEDRETVKIIKAFKIEKAEDIERAKSSASDLILLDSGQGSGRTFNWTLIRDIGRPFILAGGLKGENIARAIESFRPYGVDVSSGAEKDGVKDREKIESIVREVRK